MFTLVSGLTTPSGDDTSRRSATSRVADKNVSMACKSYKRQGDHFERVAMHIHINFYMTARQE